MAAGIFTFYSANKDDFRMLDVSGATVKIALITSGYTPNTATGGDALFSAASGNEIAGGGGYTAGGFTLTTPTVTAITGGWKYSTDPASWTASGGGLSAWRYAVMYVSGTLWGKTNPLIGYFLGDGTNIDVPATTAGNSLTLTPNANGWFDIT